MLKILCIHGVGHAEANLAWEDGWKNAIATGIQQAHPGGDIEVEVRFSAYDDLFTPVVNALSPLDVARAVVKLGGGLFERPRAFGDFADQARWTAGMVVAWVENEALREAVWRSFLRDVTDFGPDVICAHSLGTLISYDGFRRQEDKVQGKVYVTFGAQLGNPFVRGAFGGQVTPFTGAAFWHHLYNPYDHVFTAQLDFGSFLTADNFRQVETPFGTILPWPLNHDAINPSAPDHAYLTNPQTRAAVWPEIGAAPPVSRALKAVARVVNKIPDAPTHRALLVGINNYPRAEDCLEGCVNDVFQISSILQECGFKPEDIRVVLDDRATAAGIMERFHWLLDGTASGDQRFFYYSGHGAQLPAYGADGRVERIDACLAPYDFAWSRETAITDDRFVDLYSQLPYDARFMIMFDSCYSGGLTRGGTRVRGLDPPDDIRHRMLKWDGRQQMWVARDLPPATPDLADIPGGKQFVGADGSTRLLGRAVALRTLPKARYDKVRKDLKNDGPYLPIIYEACGEKEFAYEYRHGVISYGAFSYAMSTNLRRLEGHRGGVSFATLLEETARSLVSLHYDQHPVLVGPKGLVKKSVPWLGKGKRRGG